MERIRTALGFAAVALCLGNSVACAHPHVWSDMRSTVLFTPDGLVKGVAVDWTFDEAYSKFATEGLDADHDGVLSPEELAPLTEVNLESLKTYGYFIFFRKDGDVQKIGDAEGASQTFAHGRLTLRFTVPLLQPLDPRKSQLALKIYDPEFFIDFEYLKKAPVSVSGAMPNACHTELTPIPSDTSLNQTRTMLSTKGVDWKPDNNEDFGGMFAQAILIVCRP